ncbi:MAG TPA: cysteine desulfurase [archaeon]|nr:cysteine desulfurase [archaeon]
MEVYLDHAATTPIHPEVLVAMQPYFTEQFGNASSLHKWGREARKAVDLAREQIADKLNIMCREVIFTSGGTEANNWAIKGVAFTREASGLKGHIITQKTEHDCVLNACKWLESRGFAVTYLDVDEFGMVNPEDLKSAIRPETFLVTIMHANNEIGTVQPLKEIGQVIKTANPAILFHTDACQSFTKEPLNLKDLNLDLITINSHKIYGPKGVGALVVKQGTKLVPLLHGGGHEFGHRSGTINVHGIMGFGKAVSLASPEKNRHMQTLRDHLIKRVLAEIPGALLNGHPTQRLVNNTNFSFPGVEGEALLLRLDAHGIAASTGSACSSNTLEASHTMMAIGRKPELAHASIRMSLGWENTLEQMDYVVEVLKDEVKQLRSMSATWRRE